METAGACCDADNGPGGAQLGSQADVQHIPCQRQANAQLQQGFQHLTDGGGGHVALPLGVAPHTGQQAHAEHGRSQRLHGGGGQRVVQEAGPARPPGRTSARSRPAPDRRTARWRCGRSSAFRFPAPGRGPDWSSGRWPAADPPWRRSGESCRSDRPYQSRSRPALPRILLRGIL